MYRTKGKVTKDEKLIFKAYGDYAPPSSGHWSECRHTGQTLIVAHSNYWAAPSTSIYPVTGDFLIILSNFWSGYCNVEESVKRAKNLAREKDNK